MGLHAFWRKSQGLYTTACLIWKAIHACITQHRSPSSTRRLCSFSNRQSTPMPLAPVAAAPCTSLRHAAALQLYVPPFPSVVLLQCVLVRHPAAHFCNILRMHACSSTPAPTLTLLPATAALLFLLHAPTVTHTLLTPSSPAVAFPPNSIQRGWLLYIALRAHVTFNACLCCLHLQILWILAAILLCTLHRVLSHASSRLRPPPPPPLLLLPAATTHSFPPPLAPKSPRPSRCCSSAAHPPSSPVHPPPIPPPAPSRTRWGACSSLFTSTSFLNSRPLILS